jgi:tetratricopeptide (TPR) repeat protein
MKNFALLPQFGALSVALLILATLGSGLMAQAAAENPSIKANTPEELSPAELLKSYLQMREQLHTTQLAIANNRAEAEAAARVQANTIAEKLDSIKAAMEAERQRQQIETLRINAERERQQIETQRSNRTILWVAVGFGGVGLLAMLLMPLMQWRAINRMAETAALRPQLPAPMGQALLTAGSGAPSDQTVAQSNQRLMSVIDRMERRIFELEHTAIQPLPAPSAAPATALPPSNGTLPGATDSSRRTEAASDQATWITLLLNKGRSLLSANKAREAVTCYDEILKLDGNHPEALVRKGAALERLNRLEEAILCYDRAIEVDQKMTLAYLYKGGVCNRMQRYDEALECYEKALQTQEREDGK